MERGLLEQFKEVIAEMGGDWNNPSEAADLVDQALEMVVDAACELNPQFDRNSLYNHIDKRDYAISIDRFGMELADYIKDKGEDYRLILLADEVSQFINKERDRYLNLQEIITKLSEACNNQVWVACTAQQDLSEIMDDCNIEPSVSSLSYQMRIRATIRRLTLSTSTPLFLISLSSSCRCSTLSLLWGMWLRR